MLVQWSFLQCLMPFSYFAILPLDVPFGSYIYFHFSPHLFVFSLMSLSIWSIFITVLTSLCMYSIMFAISGCFFSLTFPHYGSHFPMSSNFYCLPDIVHFTLLSAGFLLYSFKDSSLLFLYLCLKQLQRPCQSSK